MTKWCWPAVFVMLMSGVATAALARADFPFDGELRLDAGPMRGSRRVPNMDVAANGAIALEMWCNRVEGQVVVAGETLTVVTGAPTTRSCSPEQSQADAELLATLSEVTGWQRAGDLVTFVGPKSLRFRIPTN